MTAGATDGAREACLAAGMDDYVSKPVTARAVETALVRWLVGGPTPGPAAVVSEPAPTVRSAVDQDRLVVLRNMGPADGSLFIRLVDAFLVEAPISVAELHEAVERADSLGLHRCAHRLRGSAANLGATGMAALCLDIEALGGDDDLPLAPDLLRRLEAELDQVSAGLRTAAAGV
jgi:HPt (histidine-containing phosphotransfer) domain-containing protein